MFQSLPTPSVWQSLGMWKAWTRLPWPSGQAAVGFPSWPEREAVAAAQHAEHVVERVVLHHDDDDVLDLGQAARSRGRPPGWAGTPVDGWRPQSDRPGARDRSARRRAEEARLASAEDEPGGAGGGRPEQGAPAEHGTAGVARTVRSPGMSPLWPMSSYRRPRASAGSARVDPSGSDRSPRAHRRDSATSLRYGLRCDRSMVAGARETPRGRTVLRDGRTLSGWPPWPRIPIDVAWCRRRDDRPPPFPPALGARCRRDRRRPVRCGRCRRRRRPSPGTDATLGPVAFEGAAPGGDPDPAPPAATFVALDVTAEDRPTLAGLLQTITTRARFLTAGGSPPASGTRRPPSDSGTLGPVVPPDALTVTLGVSADPIRRPLRTGDAQADPSDHHAGRSPTTA